MGEKLEDIRSQHGHDHLKGSPRPKSPMNWLQELDVYMPITQANLPSHLRREKISVEAIHHMMSNEFKEENEWK